MPRFVCYGKAELGLAEAILGVIEIEAAEEEGKAHRGGWS
jgi:hypothetical protein